MRILNDGIQDIKEAIAKLYLIHILGWQDVATRYRRSRVGAFWLTINMAVMIAALGLVFGILLGQPIVQFLPYLAVGFVLWNFIATSINEGCTAISDSSAVILQVKMPYSVHIARVLWRNVLILAHNIIIVPLVFICFMRSVNFVALLAIPGIILLVANLSWAMMMLSVLCARFRDVTQIVVNGVQVMFYVTPVIYSAEIMEERVGAIFLYGNPFYSLLSIVRDPLLGSHPTMISWVVAVSMALIGWFVAICFFGKYLKRVSYWL